MPKGITLQDADRRYARGSLRAFLAGGKDLNWLKGVATKGAKWEHFIQAVEELRSQGYGLEERWNELNNWLVQIK